MAKLVILYGPPDDPAAFEDYYQHKHLPYAAEHMANVRDAENLKVVGTADGSPRPYYRVSTLTYDSLKELRDGIETPDGQSVLGDLANFASGGATVLITD